jgi:hypothetical protein
LISGIDVDATGDPDPADNSTCIAAPLAVDSFNLLGTIFNDREIIED